MYTSKHVLSLLLVAATLSASSTLHAATMHDAVGEMTDKLCRYLKSKGETQIAVGQFSGPPQLAATSGPGIANAFHEHFKRNKIEVVTRANIGLKGEYVLAKLGQDGVGVKIKGSLVDPFGDVLTDFTIDADGGVPSGTVEQIIDQHEDIVQLLGTTTELHPEDRDEDRHRDLKKNILHPTLHVDGHRCSASAKSPYQIEVLIHGKAAPVRVDNGLGFVNINRGEIYAVRLHNNSDYDAAVRLTIDGLSVFTFSDIREPDGSPKYNFYIVPKHRFVELRGWHRNNQRVDSFLVTSYGESAAASINHTQNIGTITAAFSAAWAKDGTRPHDEDFTSKGAGNATGFGPPVTEVVQEVKREVGRLRSSVSLRYSKSQ